MTLTALSQTAGAVALISCVTFGCGDSKEEREREAREHRPQFKAAGQKTGKSEPGIVHLDAAAQARAGIRTAALIERNVLPQTIAYGKLEEDPSGSFVLRAPISGTLHAGAGGRWPRLGEHINPSAKIGTIEPRFTPTERIGLNTQLATARSELNAATASSAAARAAYERARILNADDKNVSDRVVQEADARLRTEEARAKSAAETVRVLQAPLDSSGAGAARPLIAERGGDVVELLAQPGESIEPGSPILRIARLDRLIARVDVPLGVRVAPNISRARIVAAGYEDQPGIEGERVAVSAAVDPKAQGTSFLFRLLGSRFGFQPGLAVAAYLAVPGSARAGFVIPQSAIVQVAAKPYVYVQTAPNRFERRPVAVNEPAAGGFFAMSGFSVGDRVVTVGAQTVLSEEFKAQLQGEEDEH